MCDHLRWLVDDLIPRIGEHVDQQRGLAGGHRQCVDVDDRAGALMNPQTARPFVLAKGGGLVGIRQRHWVHGLFYSDFCEDTWADAAGFPIHDPLKWRRLARLSENAMGLLKRLFANLVPQVGTHSQAEAQVTLPGSSQSLSPMAQQSESRRDLLRVVLRNTLNGAGIPSFWIAANLLTATSRGREPGIHVRLLIKHWDPRLMFHGMALERAFKIRLLTFDPQADEWLLGISWQFALDDERGCPPLPHHGVWTSNSPKAIATHAAAVDGVAPDLTDLLGGSILISGPAATSNSSAASAVARAGRGQGAPNRATESAHARAKAKADLERLFAVRDADLQRHRGNDASDHHFAATEPAPLHILPPRDRHFAATEPAPLDMRPGQSGNTGTQVT